MADGRVEAVRGVFGRLGLSAEQRRYGERRARCVRPDPAQFLIHFRAALQGRRQIGLGGIVDHRLVLVGDIGDRAGQCEYVVKVADRQQLGRALGEPFLRGAPTYHYQDGPRYWYSTQPTVTKLAEDRADINRSGYKSQM